MEPMDEKEFHEFLSVYSNLEHTKPEIMNYFNLVHQSLDIPKSENIFLTIADLNDPELDEYYEKFCHQLNYLVLFFGNFTPEKVSRMIEPSDKQFIDNAVAFVDILPNKDAVMMEIMNSTNLELVILFDMFEEYLFKILSMNGTETKEGTSSLYNLYLHGWGFYLYLKKEYYSRLHDSNKIDPKDSDTFFSSPIPYGAFYLLSEDPRKTQTSQLILKQLKKQAEDKTKGLYHPDDDPEKTMYKKFFTEGKTEAEGLYDMEFTKLLNKKFPTLTLPRFVEKHFIWDKDLAEFPSYYRKDLISAIDSHEVKKREITVEKWRELRKEIEEERERVDRKGASPDRLEWLLKESYELIKKKIGVVHTDQEDFEDKPHEIELPEDKLEYGIASREANVEYANQTEVRTLICEYIDSLAPQAKSQRRVGEFLLRNEIAEYINETTGHFKITKIRDDSGIPLESVKNFCYGFFDKFSGKEEI